MLTQLLTPEAHRTLLAFLARPDQGFCFCRFWSFDGDTAAWLACDPAQNRAALERALAADEVWGIVAVDRDEVIGWLRLAPSAAVPKLSDPTLDAASVLCMSVAADRRGEGVARAMLRAAIEASRAQGFGALRAYPRPEDALDAGAVWTGPRALFEAEGFRKVREGERRWTYERRL